MSTGTFVGVDLELESVAQIAISTVRVRFTQDPLAANPAGAADALNPANYTLTGPGTNSITKCIVVSGDPQGIDLILLNPLAAGTYTIVVQHVTTAAGLLIGANNTLSFVVTIFGNIEPVNQGSVNDSDEDIIRKHLNRVFKGRGWDALIASLATGESANRKASTLAFDQLTTSYASGLYLERKGSDTGVSRPINMGMSDSTFSQYIVSLTNNKITEESFFEVLRVFYGDTSLRASNSTGLVEPFTLNDGDDLTIVADELLTIPVVFRQADFAVIGQARAVEVAYAITRACRVAGSTAFAAPITNPISGLSTVVIYSGSLGLSSSVRIAGGKAQNALQFQTLLSAAFQSPFVSPVWTTSLNTTTGILTFSSTSTSIDLSQIRTGDYVNVYGPEFNPLNQGSLPITSVSVTYPGGTLTQSFTVYAPKGVNQVNVTQAAANDLLFFRPLRSTIRTSTTRSVIVSVPAGNIADVVLPATSKAVSRSELTGAYFQLPKQIAITSFTRLAGVVTVVAPAHGMAVGDQFVLDSSVSTKTMPATTAGTSSTTSYSFVSTWSTFAAPTVTRHFAPIVKLNDGRVLIIGGRNTNVATASTLVDLFTVGSLIPHGGANQYNVTLVADAVTDANRMLSSAVVLTDPNAGSKVLLVGGTNNSGTFASTSTLYTPVGGTTGSWGSSSNTVSNLAGRSLCQRSDNKVMAIGGGVAAAPSTNVETYTFTGNAWAASTAMSIARCQAQSIQLNDGTVLVTGGRTAYTTLDHAVLSDLGTVTNTCELYNVGGNSWSFVGNMSYARVGHAMFKLSDGRIIVIGGAGYNPTQSTTVALLNTTEIYNPTMKMWTPGPQMKKARAFFAADIINNRIYVAGGNTVDTTTEYLDLSIMTWTTSTATTDVPLPKTAGVFAPNGLLICEYAPNAGLTNDVPLHVLTVGSETFLSNGINGLQSVATYIDGNTFTFNVGQQDVLLGTGGTITPFKAQSGAFPGPFLMDPAADVPITNFHSNTTNTVAKGLQYKSIGVVDATQFPDAPGWLVFNFGFKNQVGPIPYLGRLSATALAIDYSFVFPTTILSGSDCRLLYQKGPWVPVNPQNYGMLYLTDSASGRIAAQSAIQAVHAGGTTLSISVTYPGTIGLGNDGYPTSGPNAGNYKVTDAISIWGSNDQDGDLAKARGH